ncbi:MAG: transglutaminase domain-containing protein, partial [Sharpea porci]
INGYHYDLAYDVNYRTTRLQEEAIDRQVKDIVKTVKGTNYQKIKQLNDYLVNHMYYSDQGKGEQYTAYGALINGHGVCQAYTLAYYRLLLEAKIDNRMITGLSVQPSGRDNHTWNIVKLDHRYYDVDVTWNDAQGRKNMYFLKGDLQFRKSHLANKSFHDPNFTQKYPLALYDH